MASGGNRRPSRHAREDDVSRREASEPLRAAVYARVSTDDQARDGTSLGTQVARCSNAVSEAGWELVGTYVDEGVSGAVASRPQLDALLRLVEDREVDRVVVTKLDRIARSLKNLLDLLDTFELAGVELVALDDAIDPSTPSGRAMTQLRGVFAELERSLTRERMMEGVQARVSEGKWVGGVPPYGYRTVTASDGRGKVLAINEPEAEAIRHAYQLLVEAGCTTGRAAAQLNRLGHRPRRAARWTGHNLRRLLLDARGLSGSWAWRRAGRGGRTAEDEVIVNVPAILTPAEHERLLAVLASATSIPKKRRPYLLTRRLTSPHGGRMQGIPGHGRSRWYQCAQRHTAVPRDERCACGRVHADTIEQAVWDEVVRLLSSPDALEALAVQREADRAGIAARERESLSDLDQQIDEMREQLAAEYADLIAAGIEPGVARRAIALRNDALTQLLDRRNQVRRFRQRNLAAQVITQRLKDAAHVARGRLETADIELRRRILELLDVRVIIEGWDRCATCDGRGLVRNPAGAEKREQRHRTGLVCPGCHRTRQVPRVLITGTVPELFLTALDPDSAPDGHVVALPFEVRVA